MKKIDIYGVIILFFIGVVILSNGLLMILADHP